MKKEIDNIFVDVRNAFRLLSRYQKRILNIVNYIREQTPYQNQKNEIADLHLSDSLFAEKAAIEKQNHTAKQQNHRHKQQCPAPINAVVPRIAVLIR